MTLQTLSTKCNNSLIKTQRYCDLGIPKDVKCYTNNKKVTKINVKLPEAPQTASHQESLQNHSRSILCAHTLHTCSSQKCFPKMFVEITLMSRDRVQCIPLWHHNCDFLSCFAIGFESTAKPQPEGQKCQSECTILTFSRFL